MALVVAGRAGGQDVFNPFAGTDSLRYQFDLSRNFFADSVAAARDRADIGRQVEAWVEEARVAAPRLRKAGVRRDAVLGHLIAAGDSLLIRGNKQLAYLSIRANLNVADREALRDLSDVQSQVTRVNGTLANMLSKVPVHALRSSPRLGKWAFLSTQLRSARAPANPPRIDSALAALTQWEAPLFNAVLRETDFGVADTPEGRRDVRAEMTALLNHPDRRVRETVFRASRRALQKSQGTHALLLINMVRALEAAARLGGATEFREQSYGQRYLSRAIVRELLEGIAATAEVNKSYERARNAHVARIASIDTVHTWDLAIAEPGMDVPRFTIREATALFRSATAPLGPEYAREVASLLDPGNGRLDLVPRAGRAQRPGFSTGSVGYPSVFFQGRYGGYMEDLIILVHEGGHSVQNMLMTAHGVPISYAGGPSYFTESFAGFNELLLLDHLYRTAPDRAHRIYYLQRFLDQSTEIYKTAREAMLEDALYDSVPTGRVSSAADLELLTQEIGSRYSTWFRPGGERVMEWVNASMAVSRPLYRVNYVVSKLLALSYFAEFTRDSATFVPRYNRLLAGGYTAPPNDLLRQFGGLAIRADVLIPRAVGVISERLEELRRLYENTP